MNPIKLFFVSFVCFAFSVSAQITTIKENQLPDAVKSAFGQKFPNAKGVTWRVNEERYDAVFKSEGKVVDAHFSKEGVFSNTETSLKTKNLPAIIIASIQSSEYAEWKLVRAGFIETNKNITYYKVGFLKGGENKFILFDT
ncbi:MAG: PepSY-like domain-containing protein, partial [Bacteroidia bacterium]|nr:PepSY-like domain-containing protein [Bacteroidia bacterium]